MKTLDSIYWQGNIDYSQYQKQNSFLMPFKKETFFAFLKKGIQSKLFKTLITDTRLVLEFNLEIALGDFVEKYHLYVYLDTKTKDITENLNSIGTHLLKIENNFEQLKNKIEVEMKGCEKNATKMIYKAIEELKEINKKTIQECEKDMKKLINEAIEQLKESNKKTLKEFEVQYNKKT